MANAIQSPIEGLIESPIEGRMVPPAAGEGAESGAAAPRRMQERTKRTRRAILAAALREFGRCGFQGASTRRMADEAGITPALIGHHYGDKNSLWKAVAEHAFARFLARLTGRHADLEGVDDWNFLRLMLREYIRFFAEEPDFVRFVFHANQDDSERLHWLVDRFMAPSGTRYMALLERAQKVGWIPEGDLYDLRYTFWGAASYVFACNRAYLRISGQDTADAEVVNRHVDLVLRLFLRPEASLEAGLPVADDPDDPDYPDGVDGS